MIDSAELFAQLGRRGIGFCSGVPDSLLKAFSAYLTEHLPANRHLVAVNEGQAVALAVGYHLATGQIPLVYMQNSGLGNATNPLLSLADPEVYAVPMLLMIGWRGEPGVPDEPQHRKQGRVTPALLREMEIPFEILEADSRVEELLDRLLPPSPPPRGPVALLVRKGAFRPFAGGALPVGAAKGAWNREAALEVVLDCCAPQDLLLSTTGKTSRELFELRARRGEPQHDFLTVGSMGHVSSIALGVALGQPRRRVICLDGDGALLMHMGALAVLGSCRPPRFLHLLLNNGVYESVGGQATAIGAVDTEALARSCGYAGHALAEDAESLRAAWARLGDQEGPVLLEIRVPPGSRADLGRPDRSPEENRKAFMEHLHG